METFEGDYREVIQHFRNTMSFESRDGFLISDGFALTVRNDEDKYTCIACFIDAHTILFNKYWHMDNGIMIAQNLYFEEMMDQEPRDLLREIVVYDIESKTVTESELKEHYEKSIRH